MKKNYVIPEMEEVEFEAPVVLQTEEGSVTETGTIDKEGGESL